jgi:hypothetical protein
MFHRGEGAPLLREGSIEVVVVEVPAEVFEKEERRVDEGIREYVC